ncbi:MAG TPA: hypothetical protein DCS93_27175 [Microscillaceae bacterium]|nr:hypothetical protein [Microscillaceae bacterium]
MNNIQLALTLIDYLIDKHAGSMSPASSSSSEVSSENNPWELLDLDADQFGQENFQVGAPIPHPIQSDFTPPPKPSQTQPSLEQEDSFIAMAKEKLPLKPPGESDISPPTKSPDKIDNQPGQFNDFDFDF